MATINVLKFETVSMRKTINEAVSENSVIQNCALAEEMVLFIVLKETTGNAVTVNIGTTVSGKEIVDTLDVAANGYTVIDTPAIARTARSIYLDSSNWNDASLEVKIITVKP